MSKKNEALNWLDRIYWRLLAADEHLPRGAHLNQVNWHERQFIANIRRSFTSRTRVPNETAGTPQEHCLWTGNIESEYPPEGE